MTRIWSEGGRDGGVAAAGYQERGEPNTDGEPILEHGGGEMERSNWSVRGLCGRHELSFCGHGSGWAGSDRCFD